MYRKIGDGKNKKDKTRSANNNPSKKSANNTRSMIIINHNNLSRQKKKIKPNEIVKNKLSPCLGIRSCDLVQSKQTLRQLEVIMGRVGQVLRIATRLGRPKFCDQSPLFRAKIWTGQKLD